MANTITVCSHCLALNRVPLAAPSGKMPICGHCKAELPIHNGITELTGASLQALVQKCPLPLVVDFWASWCGPCKAFAPIFESAAQQVQGRVAFAKLNTEKEAQASASLGIRSIPTLIMFKNSKEASRQMGALALPDFLRWLNSVA